MNKENDATRALYAAIVKLLQPLVRLSLKNGLSYQTFSSLLKWVFYEVVKKEFTLKGRKQTHSRISIITGLSRKEVKRLSDIDSPATQSPGEQYNRAARVISGWLRDKRYLDSRGRPIAIRIAGKGATFEELVKRFSGDMPTRAMLDELLRLGSLVLESEDRVRLVQDAFMPSDDNALNFHILGTDVGLLISTIDHNIDPEKKPPFFQRKVHYDNLPGEALADIRKMTRKSSRKLLDKMDRYISANDRDVNPQIEGTGRYVAGIGIYYFEKPFEEED